MDYDTLYRDRMIAFVEEMKAMGFANREIVDIFEKAMGREIGQATIHKEDSNEAQG